MKRYLPQYKETFLGFPLTSVPGVQQTEWHLNPYSLCHMYFLFSYNFSGSRFCEFIGSTGFTLKQQTSVPQEMN